MSGQRVTINSREWQWAAVAALVMLGVSSLPYLVAWAAAPEGAHFTGILVNPIDGHSYLAKMRQGWEGSWRFRLAFTPEPHDGGYLFLLHIALGHAARATGLPLIALYHAARMLAGFLLLVVAYRFVAMFWDAPGKRRLVLLILCVSSGLGWLAGALGYRSADLWVPEAFFLYSMLTTFHFPLSIALMLGIFVLLASPGRSVGGRDGILAALLSVILGFAQPFAVIVVYGTLIVWHALRWLRDRRLDWPSLGWTAVAGCVSLVYPLYGVWAIQADPILAAWNAQNQTPSPPVWDWLLSFGLMTALAIPGVAAALRRRSDTDCLLLAWVVAVGLGLYAPLALQRRLSLGLQAPVGLLAALGWWEVVRPRLRRRRRWFVTGGLIFSALTNVLLLGVPILMALSGNPIFYLSGGEWAALRWLRDEGRPAAVVLCSPMMGTFTPAWAGQPVVYGHPFETVNAEQREAQVEAFWAGALDGLAREQFLRENRVTYILAGPREAALAGDRRAVFDWLNSEEGRWRMTFEAGEVKVYEAQ